MPVPLSLRNEVFRLDDFTCVYCGYRGNDVVPDHFIPSSRGGPDIVDNLYTSCVSCNTKKRDKPIHMIGMSLCYGRFSYMRKVEHVEKRESPRVISFYDDFEHLFGRFPRSIATTWTRVARILTDQANSNMPRSAIWDYWEQKNDIVPVMNRIIPGAFDELHRGTMETFLRDCSLIHDLEDMASFVYLGDNHGKRGRIQSTDDWRTTEDED